MKWCAGCMTARDAALLVLTSDREISSRVESLSKGKGRTVANLKEYNSKITHDVLYRMVKDGLVEQVGFRFRLANKRVTL
jgi:hypothetical protein